MASTLPPNILSYIGTFLDKRYQPHCALVCKHWTESFLNAYWGNLNFSHVEIDISTLDSNKPLFNNAYRVWAVEIFPRTLSDHEHLSKLKQFFPGIRYLEFHDSFLDTHITSRPFDWSLWKSLTHLYLSLERKWESLSLQNIFVKLSVLPGLVHFSFLLYKPSLGQYTILWNDFESLHYHLPQLEYLKHNFKYEPITRDDIKSIKTVDPAQTMTRVFSVKNVDTLWLFYLVLKYPNLQHFSIKDKHSEFDHDLIDYNHQQYKKDIQLLSTLDKFFPCLKKADTDLYPSNPYSFFMFYETLGCFGTKIEYVELRYYSDIITNDDVNRLIRPISESLKALRINFEGDDSDTKPEAMFLDIYPRLVTLSIDGHHHPKIEVDNILECLPALRSLSVEKIKFSYFGNTHKYTLHPLQTLKIRNSTIHNNALKYVSLRCNQLKHMAFVNIHYNVDQTGQLIFDMPMTKLDTFIFNFADTRVSTLLAVPSHYMIEQSENDNDVLQAARQPSRINWYYVYCDRTNRKERNLKWELGRRDIEFCQRYLKDFSRRKKRGKERKDIQEDDYGFVQKRFWKKNLRYGVFVFRFKSVKSHFLLI